MENTPLSIPPLNKIYIDRFWSRVNINNSNECWNWKPKSRSRNGYGAFTIPITKRKFRQLKSHRIAYFLHYGINPENKMVCHTCDNPSCCNPKHLFMGNAIDNIFDRNKKGRQSCGEKHSQAMKKRIFIHGRYTHPERTARGNRHGSKTHPEKVPRGEKSGNAKFTNKIIIAMRNKFSEGNHSKYAIARMFNVGYAQCSKILNRKVWTHI